MWVNFKIGYTLSLYVAQMVRCYYFRFRFQSAMFKMREYGRQHVSSLWRWNLKLLHSSTLSACIMAFHVCSGKICLSDLRKFTLLTRREQPEVYVMMTSLASEAEVIQPQCHENNCRMPPITRWDFAKKITLVGKLPFPLLSWGLMIGRNAVSWYMQLNRLRLRNNGIKITLTMDCDPTVTEYPCRRGEANEINVHRIKDLASTRVQPKWLNNLF